MIMEKYSNPLRTYQIKNDSQDAKTRKEYWSTGIGLNKVDGLVPSGYLIELAKDNIEGKIDTGEVENLIKNYYKENQDSDRNYECDLVSTRIVELLDQGSFSFSPQMLKSIHKYLFKDILPEEITGVFRKYNISKEEKILGGATVNYGNWNMIKDLYEYDFEQEKSYRYKYPIEQKQIHHLADFVSRIWQVHPFGEGNTRTTAVFTELYLRNMGFDVNNDMFKEHSPYFRGALVRSNYRNVKIDVDITYEYLEKFFSNLLGKTNYILSEQELMCNQKQRELYRKKEMMQDRLENKLER